MNSFNYYSPTKLLFGKDSVVELGDQILEEYKTILFHYGGGSIKRSGLYDEVMEILKQKDVNIIELSGVEPNPKLGLVNEGIELCKTHKVDMILAVGGGSVIDSAKAIGVGAKYDGDVWDFFEGIKSPKSCLPLGVILTLPATGSETSLNTVITKEEGQLKRSIRTDFVRPDFAILNPELTMTLPNEQTFAGIMDILAHVMERYFTNTLNVDLTDYLCEGTMKSVIKNALILKDNPNNYEARAEIMLAGTIAHNGILGLGREEDWASHRIGHEITALYGTAHGTTLAIVFPAWMKYVFNRNSARFAQFAVNVFGVSRQGYSMEELALQGIERLENFIKDIGLPTSFGEAGLPTDQFNLMAEKCTIEGSVGNFKRLGTSDVVNILNLAKE